MPATRRKFLRQLSIGLMAGVLYVRQFGSLQAGQKSGAGLQSIGSAATGAPTDLTIDVYVRHDGTATSAAAATSPDAPATALNLDSLLAESLAGNIPPGSVVGLSAQGGVFTSYAERPLAFYQAQIYLANGVTYTNVPGEDVLLFPVKQRGGTGPRGPHNFLGSPSGGEPANPYIDNPATAVITRNTTGSLALQNDGFPSCIEAHGSSGSAGFGIKCFDLDILGNYDPTGAADDSEYAYSSSGSGELDVYGGTVRDIFSQGPSNDPRLRSNPVFAAHNSSKLRVTDVVVDRVNWVAVPGEGNCSIELNHVTVTNIYSWILGGSNPTAPGQTITVNNCHFDTGDPVNGALDGGNCRLLPTCSPGEHVTVDVNHSEFVLRSGAGNLSGATNSLIAGFARISFNDCTFNWETSSRGVTTLAENAALIFNDCTHRLIGIQPTRRVQHINAGQAPKVVFRRNVFDYRAAPAGSSDWLRITKNAGFADGSGFFACEFWGFNQHALIEVQHNGDYTATLNLPFEQCTFVATQSQAAVLVQFAPADNTGATVFTHCHFSGFGSGHLVNDFGQSRSVTQNCSFWDSPTGQTNNIQPLILQNAAAESFIDKNADPPDLRIDMNSALLHAGSAPLAGTPFDRAGHAFAQPNASIGAYEFVVTQDDDNDGIANDQDNCIDEPNGPMSPDAGGFSQRDTDGDGFGNVCDADFNNNGVVDPADFSTLKARFGQTGFPDQDLNGNGIVDPADFSRLKAGFGKPPGPGGSGP